MLVTWPIVSCLASQAQPAAINTRPATIAEATLNQRLPPNGAPVFRGVVVRTSKAFRGATNLKEPAAAAQF